MKNNIDLGIAERLKRLRQEKGWSLDELSERSGISRASLSRIEKAEVSPTAQVLNKLCAAHNIPLSRLLHMVEESFEAKFELHEQPVWQDEALGFSRRSVSPPAVPLAGEVIEGTLKPGACINYNDTPRPGLEHHLVMLDGMLEITVAGDSYVLKAGDCFRYQLHGASCFSSPKGARYLLFLV